MKKEIHIEDYSINFEVLETYQHYLKTAKCLAILEYQNIDEDTKIIDEVIQELKDSIQLVDILALKNMNEKEQELIFRHLLLTGGEALDNVFRDWELGTQLLKTRVINTSQLIHEATDFEFADDWGVFPPINIEKYQNLEELIK